ncbi:MAG: phosphatase PAP2 family protein [Myxococcaceae bacterium]|nr:phosphatase PAP2 family protein [Myxococcaceae bacterium]
MIAALATVLLASAPAELAYDLRVDVPLTATLGAWWLASETVLKRELAPAACRWCATNGFDEAGRGLRAAPDGVKPARVTSDVLAFAVMPLGVLAADALLTWRAGGDWRDTLVDLLLVAEAVMVSQTVNQTVKLIVGRERPFVSALSPADKPLTDEPDDNNLSFYSAHASTAFSLVTAAATIARARGYRHWWVVLAAGLPLAATTGVLRIVGDKHWVTDVLTGAALGSLVGFAMPFLFHRPVHVGPVEAELSAAGSGFALTGRW